MTQPTASDRGLAGFRALVRSIFPQLPFLGCYEYAVQTAGLTTVELLPTVGGLLARVLPPLKFPVSAYVPVTDTITPGTTCLVCFVNGDPSRPVLVPRAGDTVRITSAQILAAGLASASGGPVSITAVGKTLHGTIGVGS